MSQPAKFVQIAAMMDSAQAERALYALDDSGCVWEFDPDNDVWRAIGTEREP